MQAGIMKDEKLKVALARLGFCILALSIVLSAAEYRVPLEKIHKYDNSHDWFMKHEETFKMEGDMEEFFSQTLKAFKIATRGPWVARCLRNLGYYFVEKELYKEALACYIASAPYDSNRTQI